MHYSGMTNKGYIRFFGSMLVLSSFVVITFILFTFTLTNGIVKLLCECIILTGNKSGTSGISGGILLIKNMDLN